MNDDFSLISRPKGWTLADLGLAIDGESLTRSSDSLTDTIAQSWPPGRWRDVGVVVGVSGGADSVALLVGLHALCDSGTGFLIAAHFHHAVRTDSADADQAFVAELAAELGVRFVTEKASGKFADEASMRNARRNFLVRTAKQSGARYIALAHSADDNAETVLHHLMRGTGPAGLAGMTTFRSIDDDLVLVRPLLQASATQIRDHLRGLGRSWREDESNANTDYGRNWIRHELLPLIRSRYPSANDAIARAAESTADWRSVIDRLANQWIERHVFEFAPISIRIDETTEPAIVIAAVQIVWDRQGWARGEMTRVHWQRIADAIGGKVVGSQSLPGKVQLNVDGDVVMLCD